MSMDEIKAQLAKIETLHPGPRLGKHARKILSDEEVK